MAAAAAPARIAVTIKWAASWITSSLDTTHQRRGALLHRMNSTAGRWSYLQKRRHTNPTFFADLRRPQSLNKYQYSYNNPLRYVDPDGHHPDGDQDQDKPDVIKVNVNPPEILSVRVSIIDRLPNGSVPVGGEFEISYKYRTSLPQNGAKPEDLGRIEGICNPPLFRTTHK